MSDDFPLLLTPGPLTTSEATRRAMLRDWGSWDAAFNALTASVCRDLTEIAGGSGSHACVPMQGSGTFAVEAALGTLVPRDGKVLVPVNGAYCKRIVKILEYLGRAHAVIELAEDEAPTAAMIERAAEADPAITHVALVHCETGTGILNPLAEIARACVRTGKGLIVDAMSSFGALPIDVERDGIEAVVAASGKCLEGVPGMGFVIARTEALERAEGRSHSLSLDLNAQWTYMLATGQWRFTPPTHVVAALRAALDQFADEGGTAARGARYRRNCETLITGMNALGFRRFLPAELQAPIIVTFHVPADPAFTFKELYEQVRARGFILYPGKLTRVDTFRVGCIGAIDAAAMRGAVAAIGEALQEMGVASDSVPASAPHAGLPCNSLNGIKSHANSD
jgi:2-aminoethylphosphonate-pyruvate transaminase